MKNLVIAVITCATFALQAQKKVQEEINYHKQSVEMEYDFASEIKIKTWDKEIIRIEAVAETGEKEYTDLFRLKVEKSGTVIRIASNSKEIFERYQEDRNVSGSPMIFTDRLDHEFNYSIYVPKNIQLKISSITGNVSSDYLQGTIAVKLVSGNAGIEEFEGDLEIETVNGEIKMPVKNTSFTAKTVIGKIHFNETEGLKKKDKFIGEEVSLAKAGNDNRLRLTTVNGNIHLE